MDIPAGNHSKDISASLCNVLDSIGEEDSEISSSSGAVEGAGSVSLASEIVLEPQEISVLDKRFDGVSSLEIEQKISTHLGDDELGSIKDGTQEGTQIELYHEEKEEEINPTNSSDEICDNDQQVPEILDTPDTESGNAQDLGANEPFGSHKLPDTKQTESLHQDTRNQLVGETAPEISNHDSAGTPATPTKAPASKPDEGQEAREEHWPLEARELEEEDEAVDEGKRDNNGSSSSGVTCPPALESFSCRQRRVTQRARLTLSAGR